MKRIILLPFIVLGMFFYVKDVSAATEIQYGKPVPSVWTKAGSPYLVVDYGLYISTPVTIEPGVVVKMQKKSTLLSFASLTAVGTEAEEIVFTSFQDDSFGGDTNNDGSLTVPNPGDWRYVMIPKTGKGTIEHVKFLYAAANPLEAGLVIFSSNTSVQYSEMRYGSYGGVTFGYGAKPVFEHNTVTENGIGINLTGYFSGQNLIIANNSIARNQRGVYIDGFVGWQQETKLFATNNWWGDASGPYYKQGVYSGWTYPGVANLEGKGNSVVDGVAFQPWLGKDPFADGCTEQCFSNVLFFPGVEASRLYESAENSEARLWEPEKDEDAEKLYLDANGRSTRSGIYTKDVIDNAYVSVKGNVYKSFLEDLEHWKSVDGIMNDYAVVPYDWRLSVEDVVNSGAKDGDRISYGAPTSTPYIVEELRRLAASSRTGKVTIIAHSNGGLVTKALVSKLGAEAADLIDKIVFVAVPQSGTPQAIGAILHGYDQGLPVNWMPFALSHRVARTLAQDMPSAYGLLPSKAYFSGWGSAVMSPVITFDDGDATQSYREKYGDKIDDFSTLKVFLNDSDGKVSADSVELERPSVINTKLFNESEAMHDTLLDYWSPPSGVSVYQIAGFGEDTVGSVKYWTGMDCTKRSVIGQCRELSPKLEYTPDMVVDGDGTVVAPSALAMNESIPGVSRWWVDLKGYEDLSFTLKRKHADILEVPQLRAFIKENILTQISSTFPKFISDIYPSRTSEKRLRYFLHSPLALSARDEAGNMVNASVSDIPGAEYRNFGEVQYISLPASAHPTLLLDGEAEGSFTLEVQEIENGIVSAETTFSGVPTSADTEVRMDFPNGTISNASLLHVDYDGDGYDDFSFQSKIGETVLPDVTSPTTSSTLSGTEGENGWYTSDVTVTLSAQDNENGSGVEKIEYSLDGGKTWQDYVKPIILSQEGVTSFQYFSTDKQGNKEDVKEEMIKIDVSDPEFSFAFDPESKMLVIIGSDSVSPVTTEVSEITARAIDEAGHVAETIFEKNEDGKQIKFLLKSLAYDGESASFSLPASLHYEWSLEKNGSVKMLNELAVTDLLQINAHYLTKENETTIKREENVLVMSEERAGLKVLKLETNKGYIKISY